ncbi:ATP-binding protein [Lysinibacillus macroides]|uniref:histidine kinase n=1 Tax=Lysinibacillus macroides TaxID=33935 RepID=A0A0M9DKG9_9BACI|nr:ATP-binding protein [Lysinibacillus macroides]KOY82012.1 histidine kinase [Lysinibacillus macroides]QPR67217.1 ATP-binding protein [Lysinibacillus macroides]
MHLPRIFLSKASLLWIVIIAVLCAIAGELKFYPFSTTTLRFGLGSIMFFLCILIKPTPILVAGFVTGVSTILFRMGLDYFTHASSVWASFLSHLPSAAFYILFSICLHFLKIEKNREKPLKLGILVALSEVSSNITEQLVRFFIQTHTFLTIFDLLIFFVVAFLRSFFVVGIYSSILIAEQKKRVREMLNIGSDLYVETLYLKKSMNHIEAITANGFDLYRQLTTQGLRHEGLQALHIAQEIHEVKKDSQRIYAGISKIVGEKNFGTFYLSELLHYIEDGNQKYSASLGKDIEFDIKYDDDFQTNEHISLLALLNNLTANAIEASTEHGTISIEVQHRDNNTTFIVLDNGQGIPQEEQSIIFEPGYTTKYSAEGVAATGIGLSHVATLVAKLNGTISVQSTFGTTIFTVHIPTKAIHLGVSALEDLK